MRHMQAAWADSSVSQPLAWHALPLHGQRVLVRVDFNVATAADGSLLDDWRLQASVPGLKQLVACGARVGLLTHRGRPAGRPNPALSTQPLVKPLSQLLGQPVMWVPDCVGRVAQQAMDTLAPGDIGLLENTRFHAGESLNQQPFVQALAQLGDMFVFDAWATAHRAHASTSGLAGAMPRVGLGPLVLHELGWLRTLQDASAPPLTVLLGGGQLGPKLVMLQNLLPRVGTLMIGGTLAHTLLAAKDLPVAQQLVEPALIEAARSLLTEAGVMGVRLLLPQDVQVRTTGGDVATRGLDDLQPSEAIGDIGPATVQVWDKVIRRAEHLVWLGSPGQWEDPAFATGTQTLAASVLATPGKFQLLAGDGLLRAMQHLGQRAAMLAGGTRFSTGGGALLAALSGQSLPVWQVLATRTTV
jgi:phosphoglycerate kinase